MSRTKDAFCHPAAISFCQETGCFFVGGKPRNFWGWNYCWTDGLRFQWKKWNQGYNLQHLRCVHLRTLHHHHLECGWPTAMWQESRWVTLHGVQPRQEKHVLIGICWEWQPFVFGFPQKLGRQSSPQIQHPVFLFWYLPGVICFNSSEHLVMLGLCILGILCYPLTIISWATYTTCKYPSRITSGQGLQLVHRHRFLFQRFKPKRFYYGLLLLLRNALLALFPVIFSPFPSLQIEIMGVLLVTACALQVRLWPWRTDLANYTDLVITLLLQTLLLGISPLIGREAQKSMEVLSYVLTFAILSPFVVGLVVIGWSIWRHYLQADRFGIFLCHHKARVPKVWIARKYVWIQRSQRPKGPTAWKWQHGFSIHCPAPSRHQLGVLLVSWSCWQANTPRVWSSWTPINWRTRNDPILRAFYFLNFSWYFLGTWFLNQKLRNR